MLCFGVAGAIARCRGHQSCHTRRLCWCGAIAFFTHRSKHLWSNPRSQRQFNRPHRNGVRLMSKEGGGAEDYLDRVVVCPKVVWEEGEDRRKMCHRCILFALQESMCAATLVSNTGPQSMASVERPPLRMNPLKNSGARLRLDRSDPWMRKLLYTWPASFSHPPCSVVRLVDCRNTVLI